MREALRVGDLARVWVLPWQRAVGQLPAVVLSMKKNVLLPCMVTSMNSIDAYYVHIDIAGLGHAAGDHCGGLAAHQLVRRAKVTNGWDAVKRVPCIEA